MVSLQTLLKTLDDWMQPHLFEDYAPNGLQLECHSSIKRLALAVTASQAVIDEAVEWKADALLVHHGYFWKNEPITLTGMKGRRIKKLFQGECSLIAYHLPLDCHAEFGNNVTLLDRLGLYERRMVNGEKGLLWEASLAKGTKIDELVRLVDKSLQRKSLLIHAGSGDKVVHRMVVCTGGGQGYLAKAHQSGADVFLSGEISERTTHEARELDIHYICAGHHATETFGVQALGRKLQTKFDLQTQFFDDQNPA